MTYLDTIPFLTTVQEPEVDLDTYGSPLHPHAAYLSIFTFSHSHSLVHSNLPPMELGTCTYLVHICRANGMVTFGLGPGWVQFSTLEEFDLR